MCLITKMICPRRATRDIKCIKVLFFDTYFNTVRTPIMMHPIKNHFPVIMDDSNVKISKIKLKRRLIRESDTYAIEGGMIHAYDLLADYFLGRRDFGVLAIIPKGTLYYISANKRELCAKKLIVTNKIVSLGNTLNNNVVELEKLKIIGYEYDKGRKNGYDEKTESTEPSTFNEKEG